MAATTKRKRVSKKSKQSWRKYTDIKDVDEHLEEVRREERTGGPVSEKPNKGLFFVDKETAGTGEVKEQSRKRKILKIDQLLLLESKIKPIGSKHRRIKDKQCKTKDRLKENQSDSSDFETEENNKKPLAEKKETFKKKMGAMFDLWETEDSPAGDKHYLATTRRSKIKKPKTINRATSSLQAVEVCAAGASYNPSYEDHQSLLQTAHEVEAKKLKKNKKLDRQVQLLTVEEAASLPTWTEEMSQGLFGEDDKEENDADSDSENEGVSVGPVRAEDRKTRKQRRKELDQVEEQKKLESEKKEKLKVQDIFRLKTLKKEIKLSEQKAEDKKKRRENKQELAATKPKRLSKHQYTAANMEIKLSGEITGNLRSLKQEGNLFEDRFKSLQRRNIIETRQPVKPHRKYKKKICTRKSFDKPCIKEI